MRRVRAMALLGLVSATGCWTLHTPAPEEQALEVYDSAEDHFKDGEYDEAAREYEFVIQARDRWKDAYLKLARCYEATDRREKAIDVLDRLLRVDQFDEEALNLLGRICVRQGAPDRALACYRRLQKLRPGDRSVEAEIARLEAMGKP